MKIIRNILFCALLLAILISCVGCGSKNPKTINFNDYDDSDLFKLTGREVIIYGYFTLNPAKNRTAYISLTPYTALIPPEQDGEEPQYSVLTLDTNYVIAVSFKDTPEYTSVPVCIKGTLEGGPFYDTNYFAYNYRIKNATIEEIDFLYLNPSLQFYYEMADAGYMDILYSNMLALEKVATEIESEFPTFKEYAEIKKVMEEKGGKSNVETEYIVLLDKLNDIYEKYKNIYGSDEFMQESFVEDINDFYGDFLLYIEIYAGINPENS